MPATGSSPVNGTAGSGASRVRPRWYGRRNQTRSSDYVDVLDPLADVLVLRFLAVQLDVQAHLVGRVREAQRVLVADAPGLVELEDRLVEGLHAELPRLLHDLLDLVHLALEDEVRDEQIGRASCRDR